MAGKEIQYLNPANLFISGLDTDSDASNDPLYDERIFLADNEALIRNIMTYGVQQPVLVRQDGDRLFVVDGRQRVRASRIAATRQAEAGELQLRVPVIMVQGDDKRVQGIMISTNENREEDGILAKAIKAARMFDMWGNREEVCTAFGRGRGTIDAWLRLAAALPSVHDAINQGRISASAGIEIAALPRTEQEEALNARLEAKAAPASSATSVDPVTKEPRQAQPGVKRSWVAKTFETEAFKALAPENQAVLKWIATGETETGSWMDEFQWAVEKEREDTLVAKEAKKEVAEETEEEKAQRKAEREARKAETEAKREIRAAKRAEKEQKELEKEERRRAAEAAGKRLPGRPRKVVAAAAPADTDSAPATEVVSGDVEGSDDSAEDAAAADAAEVADLDVSGSDDDSDALSLASEFGIRPLAAPLMAEEA